MSGSPRSISLIALKRAPGVTWVGFRSSGGRLLELWAEAEGASSLIGGIARARVLRVEPGLSAVVVRLPEGEAFVKDAPKVAEGDALLVQVVRDATGSKRPVARADVELAEGPLLLTPRKPGIGLSSRITGKSRRAEIKAALAAAVPDDLGLVVRGEGVEVAPDALVGFAEALVARWHGIEAASRSAQAPSWLLAPPTIEDAARRHAPGADVIDETTAGTTGGTTDWDIEADLDDALARRVALAGGGVLTVDEAEAATLIDVDLPAVSDGKGAEDLYCRIADQIAHVARLRGLRGAILVDFPRAKGKAIRAAVVEHLIASAQESGDPIRPLGWTPGGLLELIREGVRRPLSEGILEQPGAERLPSPRAMAWRALAMLERARGLPAHPVLEVEDAVARWLMGPGAELLGRTRSKLGGLTVVTDPSCLRSDIRIRSKTESD